MRMLNNLSVRYKLKLITMLTCAAALLSACAGIYRYEYREAHRSLAGEMSAFAEIVCRNSTAAVSFNDAEAARSILNALRGEPEIEVAATYAPSGELLALYARSDALTAPVQMRWWGERFGNDRFEVSRPIELNGQQVGTTYVRSDLSGLRRRLRTCAAILGGVLVGAMAVGYGLASRLERLISIPVIHLTEVARAVSTEKNYAIRAEPRGRDELGALIGCFNEMLSQIQSRDAELQDHRDRLEDEVAARTAELEAANADLSTAMVRAESASRAKSEFLANMSHEIRTPMTAIVGYADLMLDPGKTVSDRVDHLQVIRRNARHLLDLINDILDLSKIEAEKMTVERIACDLPRVVVDTASMLRPRAMAKGVDFELEFVGRLPREIRTDPTRFRQVLMNLVGNAIKFTERGAVRMRFAAVPPSGDGGRSWVVCEIRDTGIGMTGDQVAKLFQPFMQADGSMTRRFGGTGLGLAISKRLVELLGGEIKVESRPGEGSTFTVRIDPGPTDSAQWVDGFSESMFADDPSPDRCPGPTRLDGLRVLLAEDGYDNQQLISLHLRSAGAEVVVVDNGQRATEIIASGDRLDLILMDMQMPVLDGYGASSQLRAKGCRLPIVALTAHAMHGDREKCLAAGCSDYLTKPIDPALLIQTVARHAAAHPRREPAEGSAPAIRPGLPPRVIPAPPSDAPEFSTLIRGFIARLPARVDALRRLLDEGQLDELQRLTHQIKGAGAGYGLPQVTEYAARAERAVKSEQGLERISREVGELVGLIRNVDGYDREAEAYATL